jgi:hypothetical protein
MNPAPPVMQMTVLGLSTRESIAGTEPTETLETETDADADAGVSFLILLLHVAVAVAPADANADEGACAFDNILVYSSPTVADNIRVHFSALIPATENSVE